MADLVSAIFQKKVASFCGHDDVNTLDLTKQKPDQLRQLINPKNVCAQVLQLTSPTDFKKFHDRVTQFISDPK